MDVIFISAVRANDKGSVGFLRDERRLNVAITRARYALVVIGHAKTLFRGDATWQRLINHAASNQCAFDTAGGCWLGIPLSASQSLQLKFPVQDNLLSFFDNKDEPFAVNTEHF